MCLQALLVENSNLLSGAIRRNGISEVLYAAGWIAGEFNVYLSDPKVPLMLIIINNCKAKAGVIIGVLVGWFFYDSKRSISFTEVF